MDKFKIQNLKFKVLYFLLFAFIFALGETHAQPTYDSVAAFTATTALAATDIVPMQIKVSNKYTWRKITGTSLWSLMRDTTQAQLTTLKGASNSWDGINDFDGATFNAGSHGKVLFDGDSVVVTTSIWALWLQRYSVSAIIGNYNAPFFNIYSRTFTPVNAAGNDSCVISYDDSVLTFSKKVSIPNLNVTDNFAMDSAAALQSLKINPEEYTIANVADSVIAFDSLKSNVMFNTPGNVVTPGIEKITMTGAAVGHILILYTTEPSDSIVFQDSNADGNLKMAGDFTMKNNDNIAFIYINNATEGDNFWMEIWRKDN